MLTVLRLFVPKIKEQHYAIMVDWCLANANYYINIDVEKSMYWVRLACKYLLKRIDAVEKLL